MKAHCGDEQRINENCFDLILKMLVFQTLNHSFHCSTKLFIRRRKIKKLSKIHHGVYMTINSGKLCI